jgi:hypothetical protein
MPTYPHGPRILKGAMVAIDPATHQPLTVAFQYNPEAVRRTLQPQMAGGEPGQRSLAVRYTGAPVEVIDLEVMVDAIDQLERGDATAASNGIYPQLSLLELLTYPNSQLVIQNNALLASGTLEIAPMLAPLVLFIWGPNRVVPIRLNAISISEELFDTQLNPIRATLSLNLRALSYSDLDSSTQGYNLFLAYQQTREAMARQAGGGGANSTGVAVNQLNG